MHVTALIPVKSLIHGKSRLSATLDLEHRIQLTEDALRRLIHILQTDPEIAEIAVITRDPDVANWLADRPVRVLHETGSGLNAALTEARTALTGTRMQALLVLPADLIAITAQDVRAMIELARQRRRAVVIAPDRHGRGTNALLLKPAAAISFAFGADSYISHAAAAKAAGCVTVTYQSESIGLDLDFPEDYELYSGQW